MSLTSTIVLSTPSPCCLQPGLCKLFGDHTPSNPTADPAASSHLLTPEPAGIKNQELPPTSELSHFASENTEQFVEQEGGRQQREDKQHEEAPAATAVESWNH